MPFKAPIRVHIAVLRNIVRMLVIYTLIRVAVGLRARYIKFGLSSFKMDSNTTWLMSEDLKRFLLEDPAISPDGNISFRISGESHFIFATPPLSLQLCKVVH